MSAMLGTTVQKGKVMLIQVVHPKGDQASVTLTRDEMRNAANALTTALEHIDASEFRNHVLDLRDQFSAVNAVLVSNTEHPEWNPTNVG